MLLCGLFAAPAWAEIYLCVDANGRRELTDVARRGCKGLDVPNSYPAPVKRAAPSGASAKALAPATPAPANFPRVDNYQQRQRDNDRRDILGEELRSEERKLGDVRKEFNNGEPERMGNERNYAKYQERVEQMRDSISRSEKNVDALKREMSTIK
jgi:hypothetical protein